VRILVVGAGALGGYFGAALQQTGRDVTFLVRPARATQLARNGLRVRSADAEFAVQPTTILAGGVREPFDLILLGVKSYSLAEAMEQFAPAVGPQTVIVPVLNGIAHVDILSARFGADRVMGGMSLISAALDADGHINLLLPTVQIVMGDLAAGISDRARAFAALFEGTAVAARASGNIMQDMWEKFTFLAAGNGISCLMRVSLGDILGAPGGAEIVAHACQETRAVATACGFPPRQAYVEQLLNIYNRPESPLKASMLRDIERGAPTEGEHTVGDMVRRARRHGIATPVLDVAYCHICAYEIERARIASG